jgi:hypothetical protein
VEFVCPHYANLKFTALPCRLDKVTWGVKITLAEPMYPELVRLLNRFYPDLSAFMSDVDEVFRTTGRKFRVRPRMPRTGNSHSPPLSPRASTRPLMPGVIPRNRR